MRWVMHFVTFPAGALIPAAGSRLNVPIVLLANPEKPGEGKMWEQNSFCGANLGGFVMNRLRKRYAFVRALPENTAEAVAPFLRVVRCIAEMKELRIGLAGGRVPGFYTSNFDEMKLRREFGTTVEVLELLEIVNTAQNLPEERLAKAREIVKKSSSSVCCVGEGDLELAAKMLGAFFAMADKYALNSFAVRCWPEFSDIFGIAPCAVLGMLSDNGLPTSCEGDVPGAVTMMILQKLAGGGIPFFVDLISYDEEANTGVVCTAARRRSRSAGNSKRRSTASTCGSTAATKRASQTTSPSKPAASLSPSWIRMSTATTGCSSPPEARLTPNPSSAEIR